MTGSPAADFWSAAAGPRSRPVRRDKKRGLPVTLDPPTIWKPTPHKEEKKTISLEFQLVDPEEKAVPKESYVLHKPDGTTEPGTTDGEGGVKLTDVEPGEYKIQFPNRYDVEWKFLRVEDPQAGGTGTEEAKPDGS